MQSCDQRSVAARWIWPEINHWFYSIVFRYFSFDLRFSSFSFNESAFHVSVIQAVMYTHLCILAVFFLCIWLWGYAWFYVCLFARFKCINEYVYVLMNVCMYMKVCRHIRVCVCMYLWRCLRFCMNACAKVCVYECMCVYIHVCTFVCTYVCMYVFICMYM